MAVSKFVLSMVAWTALRSTVGLFRNCSAAVAHFCASGPGVIIPFASPWMVKPNGPANPVTVLTDSVVGCLAKSLIRSSAASPLALLTSLSLLVRSLKDVPVVWNPTPGKMNRNPRPLTAAGRRVHDRGGCKFVPKGKARPAHADRARRASEVEVGCVDN